MNKNPVKFGIIVVIVGAAITGWGLLVKMSHDSCLELIWACERGDCSRGMPVCPSDDSARFFVIGSPIIGIGILVLVWGIKDAAILEQVFGRSE